MHSSTRWLGRSTSAFLFAATAATLGATAVLPAYLILVFGLGTVSVIDWEYGIIPNRLLYPTAILSVLALTIGSVADGSLSVLGNSLLGGAIAWTVLLVVHLISPSLGFGLVRQAFLIGTLLAARGLIRVPLWLGASLVSSILFGIVLVLARRRSREEHVFLGPVLFLAAMLVFVV